MGKIISVLNNKGGVGKTTTIVVLSELLAFLGKKVLTVDSGEQSNLSMYFQCFVEDSQDVLSGVEQPRELNIAEVFKNRMNKKSDIEQTIKETDIQGISILPSSKRHKLTPTEITNNNSSKGSSSQILKKALDTIKDDYDFVFIDNGPASNILTVNSIVASDYILTPVRMEAFSYKGLKETLDEIAHIKDKYGIENATFLGAFMTQAELNTNIYKGLKLSYEKELTEKYFRTPIRKDIKISEVETNFISILEYNANTNAVLDYSELLIETGLLDKKSEKILKKAIGEN